MRDPKAYRDEGRNDPHSPQQRLEHPYDFVSLPDKPAKGDVVLHHEIPADRWSGTLRLVYRLETPLHVGSGVFENAKDLGLSARDQPVRGIVRSGERPVLPGSSWKGAVRSRFEAITRSRLAVFKRETREDASKLPQELVDMADPGKKHGFELADRRLSSLEPVVIGPKKVRKADNPMVEAQRQLGRASPADSLFGCMGYRGRVCPGEGQIDFVAPKEPHLAPAQESPQPHRLAAPGSIGYGKKKPWHQRGRFTVDRVEGRKFHYDGEIRKPRDTRLRPQRKPGERDSEPSFEPIDHVPAGSTVSLEVVVHSLSEAEIGALLLAAGKGEAVGVLRFGGYKSAGLGKAVLTSVGAAVHQGSRARSWRSSRDEAFDVDRAVLVALRALIDRQALDELHKVTTMERPWA